MNRNKKYKAAPRVRPSPANSQVRAYRTMRGWRQQDLADRAGLERFQICKIELGIARPTPDMKRRIALALEVGVTELWPEPAAAPAKAEDVDAGR